MPLKYYDPVLGWSIRLPQGWRSSQDIESTSFYSPDGLAGLNISAWSVFDKEDARETISQRLSSLRNRPDSGSWRDEGLVSLGYLRFHSYFNRTTGLDVRWYLLPADNIALVACVCLAKEISGRYDAVFRQALESLALPERELPWTLVLRGRQYLMRDDLDVPGNMVETGSEWSGFPIYRRRSASGGRLFLPRGESGLFQTYEEMSYSVERARLASVAQSLQLTSYLAPPELVDIRLTIDLLNRAAGRYFERTFGLNLDGSKRSLEEVESLLRFRDWTGELMGGNSFSWTAGMIGAYFGEMLRENGHLYWSPRKPYLASVLATREGASIEPFKVAAKALVEPDSLLLGGAYARALRGVFPHPVHHSRAA